MPAALPPAENAGVPAAQGVANPQPHLGEDMDTLASHDASQLARSFQDAYDGSNSSAVDDDVDDGGMGTDNIQDNEEPLVQASGLRLNAINAAKLWVSMCCCIGALYRS